MEYIELLLGERLREPEGFRHSVPGAESTRERNASHDRWVINKIRALATYYTKGFDRGSHLRTSINQTNSLEALRDLIQNFFDAPSSEPATVASER